jgi:hypothetical protein
VLTVRDEIGQVPTLRLSWTLADLGGRPSPDEVDVEMAWALRTSDPLPAQGDNGSRSWPSAVPLR